MSFIDVKNLSLKTPMGSVYTDVSFSAEKGETVAIYGSQKSGRTSLLLSLSGRMKPSRGDALIASYSLSKKYGKIRYLSALSFFDGVNDVQPFLKVGKILAAELQLAGKHGSKKAVHDYLEHWNFSDLVQTQYVNLDAYNRAVFGFMLASTGNPEIIVVDDIETNLTQHQSIKLIKLFKEYAQQTGCCILFACSEYEIAYYADSIVVMSESAELQRQAVLRQNPSHVVKVAGSANGVNPAPLTNNLDNKQNKNGGLR